MSSASVITATAVLTSAGEVEQATSLVRAGVGSRVDVKRDGQGVLVARCGSRAAYRLLGAWARPSWLPLQARFELTADQGATQVAVSMTSDQGWYLVTTSLTALAGRQVGALSGGQRKRTFIARGLAQGADLLILDEPFAGVDKRSEATITALLRDLAVEGRTVVVSTHDIIAVPQLCDSVVLLNRRVIAHGPVAQTLVPELLGRAFGGFVPQSALGVDASSRAAA